MLNRLLLSYEHLAFSVKENPLRIKVHIAYDFSDEIAKIAFLLVDIVKVDPQAFQKKSKTPFFRDFEKPFHEVTPIGPEPHKFFLFRISQQMFAQI